MAERGSDYVYQNRAGWFAIIGGTKHGPYPDAKKMVAEHRDWCLEFFFGVKPMPANHSCPQQSLRAH